MHPVVLILSLLVFSFFLGFIGLLIAVPTTAIVIMLVREWEGALQRVMVLGEGFAWNGQTYPSLSAVALAITGFAGRGAPGDEPGRVHFALAAAGVATVHEEHHFGDVGRGPCRIECLRVALRLLLTAVTIR